MRTSISSNGTFIKKAETEQEQRQLDNEWRFLCALQDTGIAPLPLNHGADYTEMSYVVPDMEHREPAYIRTMAIRLLLILQKRSIVYPGLNSTMYVVRKGVPVITTWETARFAWEQGPEWTKDYFFASLYEDEVINRWSLIRRRISHLKGYGTLYDLVAGHGDYVALAQADGFTPTGFDTDTSALAIAEAKWKSYGCQFYYRNMLDIGHYNADIVLMFNLWDALVTQHGEQIANDYLDTLIKHAGVIYFEDGIEHQGTYEFLKHFTPYVKPVTGIRHKGVIWEIKS